MSGTSVSFSVSTLRPSHERSGRPIHACRTSLIGSKPDGSIVGGQRAIDQFDLGLFPQKSRILVKLQEILGKFD
jgi:hypothetical protein